MGTQPVTRGEDLPKRPRTAIVQIGAAVVEAEQRRRVEGGSPILAGPITGADVVEEPIGEHRPGMVNTLTKEQIFDLVAYLLK